MARLPTRHNNMLLCPLVVLMSSSWQLSSFDSEGDQAMNDMNSR